MNARIAGQPSDLKDIDPLRSMVVEVQAPTGELHVHSGTAGDPRSFVILRHTGTTIGTLHLRGTSDLASRAQEILGATRPVRPWRDGSGASLSASVIVCTTGTNVLLRSAVEALLAQRHGTFDVLVVDNAPASGATTQALAGISDQRLRIVAEERPGLSRARNRGISESRGDVIAFTDDDALADPTWLSSLLDVFASDPECAIRSVTGNAHPLELQHRSQRFFESRGGFPTDPQPALWSLSTPASSIADFGPPGVGGPVYPHAAPRVGAGVCMAFRRSALDAVGPFDINLGAGTPARGGEDIEMFSRILKAGGVIVHTPDAVVLHRHRPTMGELARQIRGNGSGMAATLITAALADPRVACQLLGSVVGVGRRLAPGSERVSGTDPDVPTSLTVTEARGFLEGAWLLGRTRCANRQDPA